MSEPFRPQRVLVTGGSGFIGRHLIPLLRTRGIDCRTAVRAASCGSDTDGLCVVGDIGPHTDWSAALDGVQAVVHLAGRAHVLREEAIDPRGEFMRVNAEGTARLVSAAATAGVRRLIYVSTIGVLGSTTSGAASFDATSAPRPHNFYSESKLAGEHAAISLAGDRLEVVIVRSPLVYGPGVRANFMRLLRWIDHGWPMPFAAVTNQRSLVSVWNLCDLLVQLLTHPAAPGGCWLVSDGEDLATPELFRRIGRAMGRRTLLVPVPVSLLYAIARLVGRTGEVTQLCGSLVVDLAQTRSMLQWSPPVAIDDALERTVGWYVREGRSRKA